MTNTKKRPIPLHQWLNLHLKLSELSTCLFWGFFKRTNMNSKSSVSGYNLLSSVTMQWHRLLKTTGLTKRCFMSFMPFPWLTRHINTNYTDRLSFVKTPWQQTPAISDRADRSVGCRRLHLGLCVVIHLWYAYMLKSSVDKYIFCESQWGKKGILTYCETVTLFNLMYFLSRSILES